MGYSNEWIESVLDKALTGYERILFEARNGQSCRNRPSSKTRNSRCLKILFGNTDRFKAKKKEDRDHLTGNGVNQNTNRKPRRKTGKNSDDPPIHSKKPSERQTATDGRKDPAERQGEIC